jgi:hypothetical protein
MILVQKKSIDMLLSQPQEGGFNMDACWACDGK